MEKNPGAPSGAPSQPPANGSHGAGPSHRGWKQQKWQILELLGHLLELLKESHSGLGALQSEFEDSNADRSSALGLRLFNRIVLAAGATPVRVLVVQNVQSGLPLFQFQGLNFRLQLVELLL